MFFCHVQFIHGKYLLENETQSHYITEKPQVESNKTKKNIIFRYALGSNRKVELAAALNRPNIIFNSSNNSKNGTHLLNCAFYC